MELDIQYVAGLFDGEGCISIGKGMFLGGYARYSEDYIRYQLAVGMAMTYRPVIEQLSRQFGGRFAGGHKTDRAKAFPNRRPGFAWGLSSGPAAAFLVKIEPYLIVKQEEARVAIEFQEHILANRSVLRYHPERRGELYAVREHYRMHLRELKRPNFLPIKGGPTSELVQRRS